MDKYHKSKLWKHIAALTYDIFPILGMFLITSLFFVLLRSGEEVKPQTTWFQLVLFAEVFFYFTYSWKIGGQTIGMRAWKIGIANYPSLNWQKVSLRFVVGVLSICLLGLGLWYRNWSSKNLTWMDAACGQPVIDVTSKPNS